MMFQNRQQVQNEIDDQQDMLNEINTVLKTYEPNGIDMTQWRILFQSFDTCSATSAELTVLIYSIDQ